MAQISGQFLQADTQAMGTIYEAPMPEMHVGKYQPKSGGLNTALTIMNGLSAGLNTAFQADKMFDFSKPPGPGSTGTGKELFKMSGNVLSAGNIG